MVSIKVPPTIELGSHIYEVLFDAAQEDREFRGTFSDRRHKILLNPELHPQQLRITYLHEVLHTLFNFIGVTPPETDVIRLAEGLGEVLFTNLGIDFDFSTVGILERS